MSIKDSIKKVTGSDHNTLHGLYVVAGVSVALALVLFLLASTVNQVKSYWYIGKGPVFENNLPAIGRGEVLVVPDIASFNFSIVESGQNVGEAQGKATIKNNKVIDYLKSQGIESRDIKTTGYNAYPKYEYVQASGRQNLVGYEVNQNITVKVRKADKAGEILSKVGSLGVSNVSGLTFTVDDEDVLKKQARDIAIEDAKKEAENLAMRLGVKLGRIVSYYEIENPAYPMYEGYGGDMMKSAMVAPAPSIERGEDKIVSTVSISFEILD